MRMLRSRFSIGLVFAAMLAVSAVTPAFADYGFANWQVTFAGTGVDPTTHQGFGFWGWCAFSGGVSSGNGGECQVTQYFHSTTLGRFTCHEEIDIDSWRIAPSPMVGGLPGFFITGSVQVSPTSVTGPCLAFFPGSASPVNLDTGIPAVPGHFNVGGLGPGLRGEFQIQVTLVR